MRRPTVNITGRLWRRKMRLSQTLTASFLAIVLLSLARGHGRPSCEVHSFKVFVLEPKEGNSTVACLRQKAYDRCIGLCDSKSTVSMKNGAVHWKQECECCHPQAYKTGEFRFMEYCTDGTKQLIKVPHVFPAGCQCTDC